MKNFKFYVINVPPILWKRGDTIQGRTLYKGRDYLRKYGTSETLKSWVFDSKCLAKGKCFSRRNSEWNEEWIPLPSASIWRISVENGDGGQIKEMYFTFPWGSRDKFSVNGPKLCTIFPDPRSPLFTHISKTLNHFPQKLLAMTM